MREQKESRKGSLWKGKQPRNHFFRGQTGLLSPTSAFPVVSKGANCAASALAPPILTDVGHVHAVLLGGVVPVGGDGRHVHAVHVPHGRVAAVEVAAVGAGGHVIWTLSLRIFTAKTRKKSKQFHRNSQTTHSSARPVAPPRFVGTDCFPNAATLAKCQGSRSPKGQKT